VSTGTVVPGSVATSTVDFAGSTAFVVSAGGAGFSPSQAVKSAVVASTVRAKGRMGVLQVR
jgi:hypothetical protein